MLRLPAVRARFRMCVLLLLIAGCWPVPHAAAQTGTPVVPQTLTGNLTYHWEGSYSGTPQSGKTETNSYTLDITLTNIQMQLDSVIGGGREANYVVKSAQVSVKGGGSDTLTFSAPFAPCQEVTQTQFVADPNGASKRDGKLTIDLPVSAGGALCGDSANLGWGEWVIGDDTWVNGCATGGVVPSGGGMEPPVEWYLPRGVAAFARGSETVVGSAVRVQFDKATNTWSGSDSTGTYTDTATEWLQGSFMSADAGALDKLDLIDVDNGEAQVADISVSNGSKRGLVVKRIAEHQPDDNMAPLTKILIKPCPPESQFKGKIVLDEPTVDDPKRAGIGIYTDSEGTQKLAFRNRAKAWDNAALPKGGLPLWVKGITGSDHMDDVHIKVHPEGTGPDCSKGEITFTVLEVDTPELRYDPVKDVTVSANNEAVTLCQKLTGILFIRLGPAVEPYPPPNPIVKVGWVVEGKAQVHPKDFNYPNPLQGDSSFPALLTGKSMPVVLDRDVRYRQYQDNGERPTDSQPFSDPGPMPGNDGPWPRPAQLAWSLDPELDQCVDVSPDPNGVIYNLDVPGFRSPPDPLGAVLRDRFAFKLFADVQIRRGTYVRCSPITNYTIFESWVQLGTTIGGLGTAWQQLTTGNVPAGIGAGNVFADDNMVNPSDGWFNRLTWNLQQEPSNSGF